MNTLEINPERNLLKPFVVFIDRDDKGYAADNSFYSEESAHQHATLLQAEGHATRVQNGFGDWVTDRMPQPALPAVHTPAPSEGMQQLLSLEKLFTAQVAGQAELEYRGPYSEGVEFAFKSALDSVSRQIDILKIHEARR